MADVSYGLAPWVFSTVNGLPMNTPPDLAVSVLDCRRKSDLIAKQQTTGVGFFAWPRGARPSEAIALGDGDLREISPTVAQRDAIKQSLGLSVRPVGSFLVDVIADAFGDKADPTGETSPPPIMPTTDNEAELHLANHSKVWRRTIAPADILAASPNGHANKVRDRLRLDLEAALDSGGVDHAKRVLGAMLLSLGIPRDEVKRGAKGRASEVGRLISPKMRGKVGASFEPADPTTAFAETFPTTTADIEGGPTDVAWVTVALSTFANTIRVVAAGLAEPSSGFSHKLGVCSSPVSSANHIVSATLTEVLGYAFACSRCATDAETFYAAGQSGGSRRLYKCVAGVLTQLDIRTPSGSAFTIRANGSTQTGGLSGQSPVAITDVSITGATRGGFWVYSDSSVTTYGRAAAWSIDDELVSRGPGAQMLFGAG